MMRCRLNDNLLQLKEYAIHLYEFYMNFCDLLKLIAIFIRLYSHLYSPSGFLTAAK